MKNIFPLLFLFPALCLAETAVSLEANARSEVVNDEMVVHVAVERAGPDVGPLNKAVLESLKSIVAAAKATPAVNSRLGNIATAPNYIENRPQGWVVRGDVILDSKNMDALRQLSGTLAKEYQLAGISFRLSEPLRTREESALISAAAKNFRQKAADIASAFGYRTYEIKEITVGQPNFHKPVYPTASMASREMNGSSGIPPAAGHTEVIVNISGIAVMK